MVESGRGKEQEVAALFGTEGLVALATLPGGEFRGQWMASNGLLYVVGGTKLYSLDSSFNATERGTIASSSGPVSMADNGTHLAIVDGSTTLYVLTLATNAFATKTESDDFQGADQVVFQDGYFIFNKPNSGQFYISAINDVTFDALDFASAESLPDNIRAIISIARKLYLLGDESIEVFYDSGAADFPFERVEGGAIKQGCAARWSVAEGDNDQLFWLGRNRHGGGVVYMTENFSPKRISTHAIEQAIQGYSDITDAEGYFYQRNGHGFYVLSFPTGNATWVYDMTTGLWHERLYQTDGVFSRHRGRFHAYAYGKHVVGDYENGKIYEMSPDIYSDDGREIIRRRIAPHITSDLKQVFHSELQVDIEAGVGLDGTGQGTDPQVMMRFSDNDARSFSNEQWTGIGKIGEFQNRARWRRLGRSRSRVYEVSISDPVKIVFVSAQIELERGAA